MSIPTKILSDEHKNILKVIGALLKECDALESGKEIDKDFFKKAIEFVRSYADKFHHAKEEDILFVELSKDGVQMHCDPTPQMLHEHELGRNFIGELEAEIGKNDKNKVIESARGYANLLKDHIFKEDNILYPMADEALNQETQKMIVDKFKKVEQNFVEANKKYTSFLEEIAKRNINT